MTFDILSSLNVQVADAPCPAYRVPQVTKVFKPSIAPPEDPQFVPELRKRRNAANLTENYVAQLTVEYKHLLINQLKFKSTQKQAYVESQPYHVHTHVEGAWCPHCYNEYTAAKARALRQQNLDKERLAAKQIYEKYQYDYRAEKELQNAQKTKNAEEMKQFLYQAQNEKDKMRQAQQQERDRLKQEHAKQIERIEQQFYRYYEQKQRDREVMQAEAKQRELDKIYAREREKEDYKRMGTFNMPLGRQEDEDEKLRLMEEMQRAQHEHYRAKAEQKREQLEQEAYQKKALEEQLYRARDAQQQAQYQRKENEMKAAKEYDQFMLAKAEYARKQRDQEHEYAYQAAQKIKEKLQQEAEQRRQQAEAEKNRLLNEMVEGKRVKELNNELENLLAKVYKIEQQQRPPIVQQECDRCDDLNEPEAMVQLSKEEIQDAAKYVPLKVNRKSQATM